MVNAGIFPGDVVFIDTTGSVEDGSIAAVQIGDAVYLRRVYLCEECITLCTENPTYHTLSLYGAERERVALIGLAVCVNHRL